MDGMEITQAVDAMTAEILSVLKLMVAELRKSDPAKMDWKERSQWLTAANKAVGLMDKIKRSSERSIKTQPDKPTHGSVKTTPPMKTPTRRKPIDEMGSDELKHEISRTVLGSVLDRIERNYDQFPTKIDEVGPALDSMPEIPPSIRELLRE